MKKILFACDLDNTIIRSFKKKKDGDICIEHIHEKEQGYIDQTAVKYLAELEKKLILIPVTTRSVEQYLRIKWPEDSVPGYAVTTNGALALENELMDEDWKKESEGLLKDYKEELQRILSLLEAEDDYLRCRCVDSMYVFAYCKEGVDVAAKLEYYIPKTVLNVIASGKKIYFLPPEFNKGSALKRLIKKVGPDLVICAGDSDIDIPMLEMADIAFCKKGMIDTLKNPSKKVFEDEKDLLLSVFDCLKEAEAKRADTGL